MRSGIDAAESSVAELKHVGAQLTQKSKETSDKTMELARSTLQQVKASLDAVQEKAREYDQKYMDSTGAAVADSVSSSVSNIANSTRQRTMDAIEMASEQLVRMKDSMQNAANAAGHGAQVTVGEAVRVGEKLDEKLGVSDKASGAAGMVTETVKNIDKRMHVTETAAAIDSKVTGGLGAQLVNKGVELVQESIEYVTETLQQAKIAATKSSTAQAVDDKATSAVESASATAGAAQDSVISAKDQAVDMGSNTANIAVGTAVNAKDAAVDMAHSARQTTMGAVGMDSGRPATDQVMEGASNMKDAAVDKGYQVKEGAQQMAGSAQQKGAEVVGAAQQKGYEMAGAAQQTGRNMKEGARDMAGSAQQKGADMVGSAQQTGHEMKESAKQGAANARDNKNSESTLYAHERRTPSHSSEGQGVKVTYHPQGGSGGSSFQDNTMYDAVKERAGEVGTGVKEAVFGMSSGESPTDAKQKREHRGGAGEGAVTDAFVEIKDTSGNIMSRSKGVVKDTKMA
ncbi:hypothetical protein Gpo141_00006706 [Globisporangium polare]